MITQKELMERLIYDPDTGLFKWRAPPRRRALSSDYAGYVNTLGYVAVVIDQKPYTGHRLAFLYMTGEWPKGQVDHINRNRSDNRWINLRDVSNVANKRNTPVRRHSRTGIKGVFEYPNRKGGRRFRAQISVNGRTRYLGHFATALEAKAAFDRAHKERFEAEKLHA